MTQPDLFNSIDRDYLARFDEVWSVHWEAHHGREWRECRRVFCRHDDATRFAAELEEDRKGPQVRAVTVEWCQLDWIDTRDLDAEFYLPYENVQVTGGLL